MKQYQILDAFIQLSDFTERTTNKKCTILKECFIFLKNFIFHMFLYDIKRFDLFSDQCGLWETVVL